MVDSYDGLRPVKIDEIPEEGIEGEWLFSPERFLAEEHPTPVNESAMVTGRLYKAGASIFFSGRLTGALDLSCARCLTRFPMPVEEELEAVYLPKESLTAEAGEIELSAEDMDVQFFEGEEISLFLPVRDQLSLATPIGPLCDENCKGLCPVCGIDRNVKTCSCDTEKGDPRFEALNKLKLT